MDRKRVSVAMATYNGEKYIGEQLTSILEQTRPVDEIIISDDASTDGTLQVIKNFMQRSSKITLISNNANLGLNANFEKAISRCGGHYIAISDQDNIWERERIEKMLAAFKDEVLVYSDSTIITADGRKRSRLSEKKKYVFTLGASPKEFYFYNAIFGHNVIFRRELLDDLIPIPGEGINYDGWLSFTASSVGKIRYLDESLACFRIHPDNITHRQKPERSPQPKPSKLDRKHAYHERLVHRLATFKQCKRLEAGERRFLESFLRELQRSEEVLFNLRLFLILLFNHRSLFHLKSTYKAYQKAFSQSIGLKYYRYLRALSFGKS